MPFQNSWSPTNPNDPAFQPIAPPQGGGGLASMLGGGQGFNFSDLITGIGKVAAYGPFIGVANRNIKRQHARQDAEDAQAARLREAQIAEISAKQNRNQIVQLPNGGIASVDPETNQYTQIRAPEAPIPQATELERNLKYALSLPEGSPQRALAERALPNYGYTEPVMQRKIAGALAVHGAPTYASTHKATSAPKPPAGFILD
jgi:hypothetical protein